MKQKWAWVSPWLTNRVGGPTSLTYGVSLRDCTLEPVARPRYESVSCSALSGRPGRAPSRPARGALVGSSNKKRAQRAADGAPVESVVHVVHSVRPGQRASPRCVSKESRACGFPGHPLLHGPDGFRGEAHAAADRLPSLGPSR